MRYLSILALVFCLGIAAAEPLRAGLVRLEEDHGRTLYIIAIGVSDYSSAPMLSTSSGANDAREFHNLLLSSTKPDHEKVSRRVIDRWKAGGFSVDEITAKRVGDAARSFANRWTPVYDRVRSWLLLDRDATAANIKDALAMIGDADSNDTVIIHFSGNGGAAERFGTSDYVLAPSDAVVDGAKLNEKSLLGWGDIEKFLLATPSQRIVILDTNDAPPTSADLVDELIVWTAAASGQAAIELDHPQHGAFTFSLLEGLRGAADRNGDGYVVLHELESHVIESVPELSEMAKEPILRTGQSKRMKFARASEPKRLIELLEQYKPKDQARLFGLAVGVSDYKIKALNLSYAAKDASDIKAFFEDQKGKSYSNVEIKLLVNEDATKAKILKGLEWLRKRVTKNDVGLVFLSGHGVTNEWKEFYFVPSDGDVEFPLSTALSNRDLHAVMRSLPGKSLVFVDACHAGRAITLPGSRAFIPLFKPNDVQAFLHQLKQASSSLAMFASSTGVELSRESDFWANGAFTKALLEGLRGKADKIGDGWISVHELKAWLPEKVRQLTNDRQHALDDFSASFSDYDFARVTTGSDLQ